MLRYRTRLEVASEPPWRRPLQDAQRSLSLIRARADQLCLNPDRIGLFGFSAGGQVSAIMLCDGGTLAYDAVDAVDRVSHRPDFALLIYPWNVYDPATDRLQPEIRITCEAPPTFLVHTHDDKSSSLGSVLIYSKLRRLGVASELHIYQNGGHGYGTRPVKGSDIGTWPDRATDWLVRRGLAERQ